MRPIFRIEATSTQGDGWVIGNITTSDGGRPVFNSVSSATPTAFFTEANTHTSYSFNPSILSPASLPSSSILKHGDLFRLKSNVFQTAINLDKNIEYSL
jgi:hypothetical protein